MSSYTRIGMIRGVPVIGPMLRRDLMIVLYELELWVALELGESRCSSRVAKSGANASDLVPHCRSELDPDAPNTDTECHALSAPARADRYLRVQACDLGGSLSS